ncbi:MAG: molecular chaperone DnaK [candidate division SR1 bacterium CG_4_9_14_3_um_filter_40_9]|nr:MAG: molecular chaperone DnaK [candidate division SR1 bacterium CG_4_9_14_3_um_filter_40_9]
MGKIIGIDLGTTNSCVSYMLGDKSEVIANAEGKRTTPSVVYIKGDELLVGDLAKRKAILEPKNVIREVKRFIGRKYSEVIGKENLPYDIKEDKDGGVLIVIGKKEYKPEQISAFILKKMKEDAEKFLGQPVTQAVITTPAYFNDSQRNATKAAGEIAGLKVERIINEPTAASLAYGEGKNKDEKVVVFDLGGGTFDVTVLEIGSEGTFQVLSTSGDTHLGGTDFDQRIMDRLVTGFKLKEGIDLTENAMAMQRLKTEAENAKHQLSQTERVDISIPFIITGKDGQPRNLEESLTRAQFENMCKDLFGRCKKPCLNALQDSKLSKKDINQIILVGGATRMPAVLKLVKEIFDKEPKATVNPDESVAQGAAIQGGIIQGDVKDILLLDVTPLSLAVEVEGGLAHVMIARNTTIPAKKNNIFTTAADNQNAVTVHVTQGERQFARDNKSLGMFNLEGIPSMRRGQPQIEVTFDIDANGILNVTAEEKSTGKKQEVKIQGSTNLSDEEITKAKAEAEKFAEEDKNRRENVESKNRMEALLYQMENLIAEKKDTIPDADKEIVNKLVADGKALKDKEDVTKEEIDEEIKRIEAEFQTIYQKYQAAPSQPAPNPDSELEKGNNGSTVEGEVIDADK